MDQQTQVDQTGREGAPPAGGIPNLAAKMAHELNNPLDAVLRFVSLAQRKAKAGDYGDLERYLADAQFGLQRMAEILRELMDIGRETHAILSRPATVPLSGLIERATRTAAALAEQKRVSLVVKSLLDQGTAPAYDLRVAQVLSNLLKNAVEAAPEGTTVRLTVLSREHEGRPGLTLMIEDSGSGVAPDILPQLFTPFVSTKPKGAGFGLGLAISRELAASLGGTVTLENRVGPEERNSTSAESRAAGCRATFTLPINHGDFPTGERQSL